MRFEATMILMFGPVSSATPNGGGSFWNYFEIAVAIWVLITVWRKYSNQETTSRTAGSKLVGVTVICAVLIGFGIWGLIH